MEKIIKKKQIENILFQIFEKIKVKKNIYKPVVDGLIETSLRGIDSHGIRLVPHYIKATLLGRINPNPKFKFNKTSLTTMIMDADHTYGITASVKAMENTIEMAKKNGTGITVVKNSSHFGAAGIYGHMAAKKNMVGYAFTNVDSLVVPYGGKERFLGTNAFCFCAPMEKEEPFCLDMATTTISWNKLMMYRKLNKNLERGWAVDKNGNETVDPHKAIALTHFGNYKGYGIALMVEMMTSLMSGMPYGPNIPHMFPVNNKKRYLSHFFMAIDIKRFQSISVYKKRMKQLAVDLRKISSTDDFDNVMIAGDPEKKIFRERVEKGIPLTKEVHDAFNDLVKDLNLNIVI